LKAYEEDGSNRHRETSVEEWLLWGNCLEGPFAKKGGRLSFPDERGPGGFQLSTAAGVGTNFHTLKTLKPQNFGGRGTGKPPG